MCSVCSKTKYVFFIFYLMVFWVRFHHLWSHLSPLLPLFSAHNSDFTLRSLPASACITFCQREDSFRSRTVFMPLIFKNTNTAPQDYACTFSAHQKSCTEKPAETTLGNWLFCHFGDNISKQQRPEIYVYLDGLYTWSIWPL